MKIKKGKLREEFSRDLYWGAIYFTSDGGKFSSKVLVSASQEYFINFFKKRDFSEKDFDKWLDSIVKKWSALGNEIFNHKVHYDVYTMTEDGEFRGLDFLMEIEKSHSE